MIDAIVYRVRGVARASGLSVLLLAVLVLPAEAQGLGLAQLMKITDWGTASLILFDELEYAPGAEGRPVLVDAEGWYGGAFSRLWAQAETEQATDEGGGDGEIRLSYGRLVTAYFDALAGVRMDARWGADQTDFRSHLAVGLKGLAPMQFEVAPTLYLSQDGDLAARFEAEYQLLITQKLVAAPRIELNAALQEVPEWGVGAGLNDLDLALRLRYEFRREFGPYVGYAWQRRFGGSAKFSTAAGEGIGEGLFVAGLRVWR